MNRPPFYTDEWYHCYTRGVEKRITFTGPSDFARFQDLLYLCNSVIPLHRSDYKEREFLYTRERKATLINIGGYCLMPNHFHLLVQIREPQALSQFMQKLGTAYTMYFNKKFERIGNLFIKPYRSKHVADDAYLRQSFAYIHLNPLDLQDKEWRMKQAIDPELENFVSAYPWSSLYDYVNETTRFESKILDPSAKTFLSEIKQPISTAITDAVAYSKEMSR